LEDNKNEIHIKYKDEILTSDQFSRALKRIREINEKTIKTYPKPTHHLMIPHDEDNEQTNNEQQTLIDFMTTYIADVKELSDIEKNNNKLFFFRDVFSEMIWSLESSPDKELNNEFYKQRSEIYMQLKSEYQKINATYQLYDRFKKIKKQQLSY